MRRAPVDMSESAVKERTEFLLCFPLLHINRAAQGCTTARQAAMPLPYYYLLLLEQRGCDYLENRTPAVSMRDITKVFGTVRANDGVNLDIYRGEILSLLGENGSGKTTLMNMLSGIYYPDGGQIYIDGEPVSISSPHEAFSYGIGMIHQHFKLVDVFTAAQNIVLGLKEEGGLDLNAASKRIKEICDAYGFDVDPNQKVYNMSVSQKQTVEIVKVLYRGADILILDEPTAVLTPQETDKLFAVLRNMRDDGKAVVIITHKLHEVEDLQRKQHQHITFFCNR